MTTNEPLANLSKPMLIAFQWADFSVLLKAGLAELGEPTPAEFPEWVVRCAKKVSHSLFPKLYELGMPQRAKAYKLGLCMGLMMAADSQLERDVEKLGITLNRELTEGEWEAVEAAIYGPNSGVKIPRDGSSLIPTEVTNDFEEAQADLGLEERGLLHLGISDALLMMAGKNRSTLATALYLTLTIYWRLVDRLQSIDELHEFLVKVHGINVVGSDIKRTRQLCQRVGKRFAPPGRPKLPHSRPRVR